jgi:hypothetical protein
MKKTGRLLLSVSLFAAAMLSTGCAALPGGSVTNAATVVYTAGATQHTAAVEMPVEAATVFEAVIRVIEETPDVEVVNRNDKAFLIEVVQGERRVTGQVTKLGSGTSLLYIWADAGSSGETGRELAISAVEIVCDELDVEYKLVTY